MWPVRRLKAVADVSVSTVDKLTVEGQLPVRLCNYTDVYAGGDIRSDRRFMTATATADQARRFGLRVGQTLITKDSETAEDIGAPAFVAESAPELLCGYHVALLTPRVSEIDPRFLYWAVSSEYCREQLSASALGVTRFGLRADAISNLLVPVPLVDEQRRIAADLDRATSRLDEVIAKKLELRRRIVERLEAELDDIFAARTGVRFKRLLAGPLAYGVLVPKHDADGVPMLRIKDFAAGEPDPETVARIPLEQSLEFKRTILREGDLVVSVVGTLGRAAQIGPVFAGANVNRALARVQLKRDVPAELILAWFSSSSFRRQADQATSSDSAQPTLNLGDLRVFDVGIPSDSSPWPDLADRVEARRALSRSTLRALDEQVVLLREHRQATISSAVTESERAA